MSKYFNINHADQDLTFIINKSGYGKYVRDLEQRINKAIEYIEELDDNENSYGDYDIHYQVKKELLDILKGSDSNE